MEFAWGPSIGPLPTLQSPVGCALAHRSFPSTSGTEIRSHYPGTTTVLWPYSWPVCYTPMWRDVRVVEGAALEKRCSVELPWVRIPLSPPADRITRIGLHFGRVA